MWWLPVFIITSLFLSSQITETSTSSDTDDMKHVIERKKRAIDLNAIVRNILLKSAAANAAKSTLLPITQLPRSSRPTPPLPLAKLPFSFPLRFSLSPDGVFIPAKSQFSSVPIRTTEGPPETLPSLNLPSLSQNIALRQQTDKTAEVSQTLLSDVPGTQLEREQRPQSEELTERIPSEPPSPPSPQVQPSFTMGLQVELNEEFTQSPTSQSSASQLSSPQSPPQQSPPQELPPQELPPQQLPPQQLPPQQLPPQQSSSQELPPQQLPPQELPPQQSSPQQSSPQQLPPQQLPPQQPPPQQPPPQQPPPQQLPSQQSSPPQSLPLQFSAPKSLPSQTPPSQPPPLQSPPSQSSTPQSSLPQPPTSQALPPQLLLLESPPPQSPPQYLARESQPLQSSLPQSPLPQPPLPQSPPPQTFPPRTFFETAPLRETRINGIPQYRLVLAVDDSATIINKQNNNNIVDLPASLNMNTEEDVALPNSLRTDSILNQHSTYFSAVPEPTHIDSPRGHIDSSDLEVPQSPSYLNNLDYAFSALDPENNYQYKYPSFDGYIGS